MLIIACFFIFALFASGVYLILQRNLLEVLIGIALLSQCTNMVVLVSSGWEPTTKPPVVSVETQKVENGIGTYQKIAVIDPDEYADPLPQALVLTAIVIGFALISFLIVLVSRALDETGTLELAEFDAEEDLQS